MCYVAIKRMHVMFYKMRAHYFKNYLCTKWATPIIFSTTINTSDFRPTKACKGGHDLGTREHTLYTLGPSISPFSSIYIKYHLSNFTNFTNLYSLIWIEAINWVSCMPKWNQDSKPQFTHKNQINFTMCIHIFMSILVNPNQYSQLCKVSQVYSKVAYN